MKCDTDANNIGKCIGSLDVNDNNIECIDFTDEAVETRN